MFYQNFYVLWTLNSNHSIFFFNSFLDLQFIQLVNHRVSPVILKKVKDEVEEFYKLHLEELMKYKPNPGDVEGYGGVIRADKKLDWGDKLYVITNPVHRRKPHLFPQLPSELRSLSNSPTHAHK